MEEKSQIVDMIQKADTEQLRCIIEFLRAFLAVN